MKIDNRSLASWLVSAAVVLALLSYGRDFFVPLVFALLLWTVLNALKNTLRRGGLSNRLAWMFAFGSILGAIYIIAAILAGEAAAFSTAVPVYNSKLTALWLKFPYRNMLPMLNFPTLAQQYNLPGIVGQMAASIGSLMFNLLLVLIFVAFLLVEQRHMPQKIGRLQRDPARRGEAAEVIRAIVLQLQSYIGVCTFLSVVMGLICFLTLSWLNVDFAGFWALVLFFFTYIPTVGALVVVLPALTALAQFGTAGPALAILIILSLSHFILSNVVLTVMLGRSLNLSPFAIIVSLTFWGLVWGIAGLFLAVPLTGAAAIACRHIEGLEWVAELIAGPPPSHWRLRKVRLDA